MSDEKPFWHGLQGAEDLPDVDPGRDLEEWRARVAAHIAKNATREEIVAEGPLTEAQLIRYQSWAGLAEHVAVGESWAVPTEHLDTEAGRQFWQFYRWQHANRAVMFDGPPLPVGAPARAPFPLAALPEVVRDYVAAVAWATQTPVDLAACLALAVVGGGIAKRVEVKTGSLYEPVNLYVVVALPPGERKSSVFRQVTSSVIGFQREQAEKLAPEIQRRTAEWKVAEQVAQAKARQAAAGKITEEEAVEALNRCAAITIPHVPRLVADDVTPERFVGLLEENAGRIVIASAEGGFLNSFDEYQKKAKLDPIKKAHSGDDIWVDRVGRPPQYVSHPAATVALTVQPAIVAKLAGADGYREEGLLARFLYSMPESTVGTRITRPAPVPEPVAAAFHRAVLRLYGIPEPKGLPHVLGLSGESERIWDAYREALEPRLPDGADLGHIGDWANKLPGAGLRVLAGLHMVEHGPPGIVEDLRPDTMRNALTIADYFLAHALDAFGVMGADKNTETARRIIAWAERGRRASFTEREVYQAIKHGTVQKMRDLEPAFDLLRDHRWISDRVPIAKPDMAVPSQGRYVNPEAAWLHEG